MWVQIGGGWWAGSACSPPIFGIGVGECPACRTTGTPPPDPKNGMDAVRGNAGTHTGPLREWGCRAQGGRTDRRTFCFSLSEHPSWRDKAFFWVVV